MTMAANDPLLIRNADQIPGQCWAIICDAGPEINMHFEPALVQGVVFAGLNLREALILNYIIYSIIIRDDISPALIIVITNRTPTFSIIFISSTSC